MKKILIIRFSSIGDIVLTTPVMRCIKSTHPLVEIHYLTKSSFSGIVATNPFISKVISFESHIDEVLEQLKDENYNHIIDLHHNIRSALVKQKLGRPSSSFNKLNLEKWVMVNLKVNKLPDIHIVNRYMNCIPYDDVKYDGKGLDYNIPSKDEVALNTLPEKWNKSFYAFVIGAKHATKRLPAEKIIDIINQLDLPVLLLGGKEDSAEADVIKESTNGLAFNTCGIFNLNQSASLVKQSKFIITHDTGLMHIASAFGQRIISVWGNTIPEFGMYPFLPEGKGESVIIENKGLSCRPCSKIGFEKCPKHHFKCMNEVDVSKVVSIGKGWWQNS